MAALETLSKIPSCIAGLDEILDGGLPEGRTTLIEGGPGTGKSVFALEFLYRNAMAGRPGIFVAFEERAGAVREDARTLGWDLSALETDGKLFILEARIHPQAVVSGDFKLSGLLGIIEGQSKAMGANIIVFDAVDVLLRLYDDPSRERGEMYALHEWLIDRGMTVIITAKATGREELGRYEFLHFMADCVIKLTQRPGEWVATRELQVIKYRGSDFGRNNYPFIIEPGGLVIIPISQLELQHLPLGEHMSSGNPQLDMVLGGGYRRGSSVLIAGVSGSGKTTLANTFVAAATARGEKVLYLGFEESEEAMTQAMLSPGIDLCPAIASGMLLVATILPEAFGTEKHLVRALKLIREFRPDHVVVDAISAFSRMGSGRAAFEFALRMVNHCKEKGITVLLTNQTTEASGDESISGIGVSSIIDTIVRLRFVETGNRIRRAVVVVKSRGSKPSDQYYELRITDRGIEVPGPLRVDRTRES